MGVETKGDTIIPKEELAGPSGKERGTGAGTVTAVNRLPIARSGETIELSAREATALAGKDLTRIHVKDAAGKELLCQAVDADGDGTPCS